MNRYCKNCGRELKASDVKCPGCGVELNNVLEKEEKIQEKPPVGLVIFLILLIGLPIPLNYWISKSMENGNSQVVVNVISFMVFLTSVSLYKETKKKYDTPVMKWVPIIAFILIIISSLLLIFSK